jgi:undecaprenyl diphosphate synthase
MNVPKHVAIIMDGNGRWAQARGRPRIFGHIRGSSRVRPLVKECGKLGVQYLTLFAFSTENWGRPTDEVGILMRILEKYLVRERKTLMKNNVRLSAIGEIANLPVSVQSTLNETIRMTAHNTGLRLTFALSYGSRQELIRAAKELAKEASAGILKPEAITEENLQAKLWTAGMPDPDLIIRSSGEFRISNFLLWQGAYSELYFSEKLWPEFDISELHRAFAEFSRRTRRFGLTDDQIMKRGREEAEL